MATYINRNSCFNCLNCVNECPVGAIQKNNEGNVIIQIDICIDCGECVDWCPFNAIHSDGTGGSLGLIDGNSIMTQALTWSGTPYQLGGSTTNGVDCSNLVHQVYNSLGLYYPYTNTATFANSQFFFQVDSPQTGDVVLMSGHMGIHDSNPPMAGYTLYSATTSQGVRYGKESWFQGTPRYYRFK